VNVRDVMTKDPVCCPVDARLGDVARQMLEHDCGAIPVLGFDGRPVGILTDRDIVVRAVAEGRNPLECSARDVMTGDLMTVRPEDDLEEAAEQMQRRQVRRAVVVDEDGEACGILAQADIAKHDEDLGGEVVQAVSQEQPSAQH